MPGFLLLVLPIENIVYQIVAYQYNFSCWQDKDNLQLPKPNEGNKLKT